MQEERGDAKAVTQEGDLTQIVRGVIEEFLAAQKSSSEPAYKAELQEERRRREQLERRVNELVEENKRSQKLAEESDRHSQIRAELQRLGVAKVDLAFRVVKDEISRMADGSLAARSEGGEQSLKEYLQGFVRENPEFLPARIAGGAGLQPQGREGTGQAGVIDLERIKPGMSAEELQTVREQISQIASQNLRG